MAKPETAGENPPCAAAMLGTLTAPKVYRAMKKGVDDYPLAEQSASGLGVRSGIDITLDQTGNVVLDGNGMSVAPAWRVLELHRIPKRLGTIVPGARGSNATYCFTTGTGPFAQAPFAPGLELLPDTPAHGCVAPTVSVPLRDYEDNLATTRTNWTIDES